MTIRFEFRLDLERLSDLNIGEPHNWEGVLHHGFFGSFGIHGGDDEFRIAGVALLWVARAMHSLLTTTVLYRIEPIGGGVIPDKAIDVGTSISGDDLLLTVEERKTYRFSGPLLQTLGNFGSAYKQLIGELVKARRDIAEDNRFMALIPDGLLLSRKFLYSAVSDK